MVVSRIRLPLLAAVLVFVPSCAEFGSCSITEDMRTTCIPGCVGTTSSVQLLADIATVARQTGSTLTNAQALIGGNNAACTNCARVVAETVYFEARSTICSSIPGVSESMRTTCIPNCAGSTDSIRLLILLSERSRAAGETLTNVQQALTQAFGQVCTNCVRVVTEEVYTGR